ncbi:hypothetical protein GA0115250_13831 [Streptomyces sp. BvitLS-983]|nr:hypothetical protein GA0115250_13831 [Streptomyces sp. BvitLS-983]
MADAGDPAFIAPGDMLRCLAEGAAAPATPSHVTPPRPPDAFWTPWPLPTARPSPRSRSSPAGGRRSSTRSVAGPETPCSAGSPLTPADSPVVAGPAEAAVGNAVVQARGRIGLRVPHGPARTGAGPPAAVPLRTAWGRRRVGGGGRTSPRGFGQPTLTLAHPRTADRGELGRGCLGARLLGGRTAPPQGTPSRGGAGYPVSPSTRTGAATPHALR